jgi:hypothetical protein
MPCPPHLSICNMANERQVADDSIYIEKGGKIDVREYSFVIGYGWWDIDTCYFSLPRRLYSEVIVNLLGHIGCNRLRKNKVVLRITK